MKRWRLIHGDAIDVLQERFEDESVQCCVTSPPYWGLRDYGVDGQIGLEGSPKEYVERLIEVFAEVRRVLRSDGTLWLNLGDSYAREGGNTKGVSRHWDGRTSDPGGQHDKRPNAHLIGLKPKDLCGIPWRVAFALQADGWYLRSDIIWAKPNPMPENVKDRPTKAHEYIFLLSKSKKYYYDYEAILEPAKQAGRVRADKFGGNKGDKVHHSPGSVFKGSDTRNKRTVWTITTKPYRGAHFATFPPDLIEPCVLAGAPEGGVVLDPFAGAGTVGLPCIDHKRSFVGIELNRDYWNIARKRLRAYNERLKTNG